MSKKIDIYFNWKFDCIPDSLKKEDSTVAVLLFPEIDSGYPRTYSEIQTCADEQITAFLHWKNSAQLLRVFTTSEHFIRRIERRFVEGAKIDITYCFVDGSTVKLAIDGTCSLNGDWPDGFCQELAEGQLPSPKGERLVRVSQETERLVD